MLTSQKLTLKSSLKNLTTVNELTLDTIYHQDCLNLMDQMPKNFIDLVVTSPPYDNLRDYEGHASLDFKQVALKLFKVVKKGGVVVWVVGDQTKDGDESGTSFRQALLFKKVGFKLFDTMIYLKPPRGACGNNQTYWQSFEYMFVFFKRSTKNN